ncbi:MAG TPA: sialidase family protein [Luteimonas sp.]|nr:sialidase family protein [Luteimonas sp.]
MLPTKTIALLLLACAMLGCRPAPQAETASAAADHRSDAYIRHDWLLPASPGAAQPDLVATSDGRLLLSWINRVPGRRTALQFAAFGGDAQWQGAPRTIAVGDSFFINWADTPHIAATADGALWVHWLQKSAAAPYAYDVLLSRSLDDGFTWSPPVLVNNDGKTVEHGFVSLWPQSRDTLGVAWLDARNSGGEGAHGGMMSLRSAIFSGSLQRTGETELDASTCDCCQTDVAMTARGPLLVYRDRTATEIRDIYVTRRDGDTWTAPKPVHSDGWKMPACPVNGPAVAADDNAVVVAWYTAAGDKPSVQLARSSDAGDSFAAPVTLEQGEAVQGRVDVALDAAQAWVLWVREDAGGQSVWLARYAPDLSRELSRVEVTKLQGRGRATGFPQLALRDGNAYLVWTDIVDGAPQLRGAVFSRN